MPAHISSLPGISVCLYHLRKKIGSYPVILHAFPWRAKPFQASADFCALNVYINSVPFSVPAGANLSPGITFSLGFWQQHLKSFLCLVMVVSSGWPLRVIRFEPKSDRVVSFQWLLIISNKTNKANKQNTQALWLKIRSIPWSGLRCCFCSLFSLAPTSHGSMVSQPWHYWAVDILCQFIVCCGGLPCVS